LRWKPSTGKNKQNKTIISVNSDGTICYWHAQSGKQIERKKENNAIMCIDTNTDGSKYATAGKDFVVRIYDFETFAMTS